MHEHSESGRKLDNPYYAIHEVYYDHAGNPSGCTSNPVTVGSEDIGELTGALSDMIMATERPVLSYEKFLKQEDVGGPTEQAFSIMEEAWGKSPTTAYSPVDPGHCAWESFLRFGRVPSAEHITQIVEERTKSEELQTRLAVKTASARRRSIRRRMAIAFNRIMTRFGL
jgi:hypothetical protein